MKVFRVVVAILLGVLVSGCAEEPVGIVEEDRHKQSLSEILPPENVKYLDSSRQYRSSTSKEICDPGSIRLTGSLPGTGYAYGYSYSTTESGQHFGWMYGPEESDFNLRLYKRVSDLWDSVAHSYTNHPDENFGVGETPGEFLWVIYSVQGGGPYIFCLQYP